MLFIITDRLLRDDFLSTKRRYQRVEREREREKRTVVIVQNHHLIYTKIKRIKSSPKTTRKEGKKRRERDVAVIKNDVPN